MGFTLLPGAPGRVSIRLGCGFLCLCLGAIPQGATIGAAFLVATVASVNGRTKGDFRVLIVLSENAFTVRAFGKIVPRRGVTGGRFISRNRIILFTAARCPSSIRITTSRLCRIFSRIIVTSRGRGYSLDLSAPSAGRCGGRVGDFRCGGVAGVLPPRFTAPAAFWLASS